MRHEGGDAGRTRREIAGTEPPADDGGAGDQRRASFRMQGTATQHHQQRDGMPWAVGGKGEDKAQHDKDRPGYGKEVGM